jgi:hypothetical protein
MEVRQLSFCFLCFARLSRTAATSTPARVAGFAAVDPLGAEEAVVAAEPAVAAEAGWPKITDTMSPKTLMATCPLMTRSGH